MTERGERGVLAAIVAVAAAVRFVGLGTQSLWIDECFAAVDARLPLGQLWALADGEAPLHKLLLHALGTIGFTSDAAIRLPSAVAGTLVVPLAWALARRVGDRTTALVAAALLAIHPLAVWFSQEARTYALVMLCAVGATLALLRARDADAGWGARLAYAAWVAVGVGCHWFFAFVVAAHAVVALVDVARAPARRRAWAGTLGLAVALALVWLPALPADLAAQTAEDRTQPFSWVALPYTGFTFVGGFSLGPPPRALHAATVDGQLPWVVMSSHAPIVAVALLVSIALLVLGAPAALRRGLGVVAAVAAVPVLWPVAVSAVLTGYRPRYALAALPCVLVWQALALRGRAPRVAVALLGALAALEATALAQLHEPRYVREDVRDAAAWVAQHAGGVPVLLLGEGTGSYRCYAPAGQPIVAPGPNATAHPALVDDVLNDLMAVRDELVVVASREWTIDPRGAIRARIDARFAREETVTFPGVAVWRYRRRGAAG